MRKQIREIQPAHKSYRITVAAAIRAFRQVRGTNPKCELFDTPGDNFIARDASTGRFVARDVGATSGVVKDSAHAGTKKPRVHKAAAGGKSSTANGKH